MDRKVCPTATTSLHFTLLLIIFNTRKWFTNSLKCDRRRYLGCKIIQFCAKIEQNQKQICKLLYFFSAFSKQNNTIIIITAPVVVKSHLIETRNRRSFEHPTLDHYCKLVITVTRLIQLSNQCSYLINSVIKSLWSVQCSCLYQSLKILWNVFINLIVLMQQIMLLAKSFICWTFNLFLLVIIWWNFLLSINDKTKG